MLTELRVEGFENMNVPAKVLMVKEKIKEIGVYTRLTERDISSNKVKHMMFHFNYKNK